MSIFAKIMLSVVSVIATLFGGFIFLIIAALSDGGNFYQSLVVICGVSLLFFIFSFIWKWFKVKTRCIIMAVIVGIVAISITGVEINKAYHNGIETVNEQEVDLTIYEPFRENTKAVSLHEPSTLTLNDDLPKIDGATALYPLYSAFAKATYPDRPYEVDDMDEETNFVVCTNTVGAYERLIRGEADVIFVAGPSEEQQQLAKDVGVELILTPIGREAFVFFVNAKNPIDNLPTEDIQKIYSGEVNNWKYFGLKNSKIRAFQRPDNSGSQTMLTKIMGSTPLMTPTEEDVATGMDGIIRKVSAYKNYDNAIGYSFLFFATEMVKNNKIKLISVNGIAPTRKNIENKSYPYSAEFYAVTAGTENENAQKLIDWILSEQGQSLIQETGYTPIK